jgi:hypothetical protein
MSADVALPWPLLNDQTISVVNSLRNMAVKAKVDFNAVRFFADAGYARHCIAACERSSRPELAALAGRASQALFGATAVTGTREPASQPVALPSQGEWAAEPQVEKFIAARTLMNNLAVDSSGLMSLAYVLRLERAASTSDLLALMPPLQKMVARRLGASAAQALMAQVSHVLAR